MLVAGWTMFPQPWLWTLTLAGMLLIPSVGAILLDLFHKPGDVLLRDHLISMMRQARRHGLQILFTVVCLPYEAYYSLDAILRTVWRMLVSHKRMLEWNPFQGRPHHAANGFAESCKSMWIAPVLSTVVLTYLMISRPSALFAALPVLVLWLCSPFIAWWVSRPVFKEGIPLNDEQIIF